MRRLAVLIVVVTFATGCGASKHLPGFHSADHHYSVTQVRQAFATQGIKLRRLRAQALPGFVVLRYGPAKPALRSPNFVSVAVRTGRSEGLQYLDPRTVRHASMSQHANVIAFSGQGESGAVKTALGLLH